MCLGRVCVFKEREFFPLKGFFFCFFYPFFIACLECIFSHIFFFYFTKRYPCSAPHRVTSFIKLLRLPGLNNVYRKREYFNAYTIYVPGCATQQGRLSQTYRVHPLVKTQGMKRARTIGITITNTVRAR